MLMIPVPINHHNAVNYEARIEELTAQKAALELERDGLAFDKAELTVSLDECKAEVDCLKADIKELRKKEKLFQRKPKPDSLFSDILVPMLKLDPAPVTIPETMEVQYRKPSAPTSGYADIVVWTVNTVTNKVIREKKRAICKSQKSPILSVSYV
ncbi:hypothetical protein NMY22_g17112 [Coprinellus aureogranulatus]|nr:hypothetical protein NMY22_g17112 [Coprinellus aureogranulatus]